jgi:hypothetical protein
MTMTNDDPAAARDDTGITGLEPSPLILDAIVSVLWDLDGEVIKQHWHGQFIGQSERLSRISIANGCRYCLHMLRQSFEFIGNASQVRNATLKFVKSELIRLSALSIKLIVQSMVRLHPKMRYLVPISSAGIVNAKEALERLYNGGVIVLHFGHCLNFLGGVDVFEVVSNDPKFPGRRNPKYLANKGEEFKLALIPSQCD